MGKWIGKVLSACMVLVFIWLAASFADVNMHNVSDNAFQSWNAFSLLAEWHSLTENETNAAEEPAVSVTESPVPEGTEEPEEKHAVTESIETKKVAEKRQSKAEAVSKSQIRYLASVMHCENGDDERKALLTGIVVMKRVKHRGFPDSIKGVISQHDGVSYQYSTWRDGMVQKCTPSEMCMELAEEILRLNLADSYPDGLIYQSEFPQGSSTYEQIGHEYFCIE